MATGGFNAVWIFHHDYDSAQYNHSDDEGRCVIWENQSFLFYIMNLYIITFKTKDTKIMNLRLILSAKKVDYVISEITDDVGCFFCRIRLNSW